MKKYSKIENAKNIIFLFFKAVPVNCIISIFIVGAFIFYNTYSVQITAMLFKNAEGFAQGKSDFSAVIFWTSILVGMRILQSLFIYASGVNGNVYLYRKATHKFRLYLIGKTSRLPLICYEDAKVNEKLLRAQNVINDEKLSDFWNSVMDILMHVFSLIGISALLAGYSLWLLLIAIPSVLPFIIVRILRGSQFYQMRYSQAKSQRHMEYYWRLLFDRKSRKEIQVYDFSHYIQGKWKNYSDTVDQQNWRFMQKESAIIFGLNGISLLGYLLSILITVYMVHIGNISIGIFGACLSAFLTMQKQTQSFFTSIGNAMEELRFCTDYLDFLELPDVNDGNIPLKDMPEMIKADSVSFRYPNSVTATIDNVTLKIHKGESIALVGENGSGKTTLLRLLLGLYDCESGRILYDQVPIQDIDKKSLYAKLSLMQQSPIRYNGTVREAVTLSAQKSETEDLKILQLLHTVKADSILNEKELDMKIGHEIGERELSGGEWQKIALARALYRDGEIAVLDEPTSAIDPMTEMEILKTFLDAFKGRTSIIVSHRVGICTCVDTVVMMQNGKIAEYGSHEELMKKEGAYYNMFLAQAGWYR